MLYIFITESYLAYVLASTGTSPLKILKLVITIIIRFEGNLSKTLHGVLLDLKYEPSVVKHVCHEVGQKHDP